MRKGSLTIHSPFFDGYFTEYFHSDPQKSREIIAKEFSEEIADKIKSIFEEYYDKVYSVTIDDEHKKILKKFKSTLLSYFYMNVFAELFPQLNILKNNKDLWHSSVDIAIHRLFFYADFYAVFSSNDVENLKEILEGKEKRAKARQLKSNDISLKAKFDVIHIFLENKKYSALHSCTLIYDKNYYLLMQKFNELSTFYNSFFIWVKRKSNQKKYNLVRDFINEHNRRSKSKHST